MDINIESIPHSNQPYNTVGNWWFGADGTLEIRVSKLPEERYESLIAFHELAEALMCKHQGITTKEVDEFDMAFLGDGEPGDSIDAPYKEQHSMATALERALSVMLGVDWQKYDDEVNKL